MCNTRPETKVLRRKFFGRRPVGKPQLRWNSNIAAEYNRMEEVNRGRGHLDADC
jgi:hypothetical protein